MYLGYVVYKYKQWLFMDNVCKEKNMYVHSITRFMQILSIWLMHYQYVYRSLKCHVE